MDPEKTQKLNETIAELQNRFGTKIISRRPQTKSKSVDHVSTTFPALDAALAVGGLPHGRISEIIGIPTSGITTTALRIMAKALEGRETAVYIDPGHIFDPAYGSLLGIEFERMILVRPHDLEQGLSILSDFILSGNISILIFDVPHPLLCQVNNVHALGKTLERIIAPLGQSNCILLFLSALPVMPPIESLQDSSYAFRESTSLVGYPTDGALPHFSSIRLFFRRKSWIFKDRDIWGYYTIVTILKNKLGPAGQEITIELEVCDEL